MTAVAIIPARYASQRLPGKPLLAETGKPLVVHVADAVARARSIAQVLIATDDRRIADAVKPHGYTAVMTRADHPNGTSRIAEVAETLPMDVQIIVNVQGDEPEIDPELINKLVARLQSGSEPMATAVAPFAEDEDPANPNIVKVVLTQHDRALYFSRSLVPHVRDAEPRTRPCESPRATLNPEPWLKHLGLYAYRRAFLEQYVRLAPTPAEGAEKLEQLRVLEHGHAIACVRASAAHPGIDTREQYEAFVARHRQRTAASKIVP